jgi:glycosyltransferase involved in cell wall biosynthesis
LKAATSEYEAETTALLSAPGPQKVMHVTWSLVAGGSEMYAFTIASNLDPALYSSAICAVDQGGALEAEVKREGIPYFVMNRRQGIELGLMWRLFKLFRKARARVIHTHHFNQLFYSALAAKLLGARVIHTEHSVECFKRKRLRVALRVLSVFCHRVIAIGDDGARVLLEDVGIPKSKLEIIRAGVDASAFCESRKEARAALGLDNSARVVAIVARLFPEKNHIMLLRAFAEVSAKVEGARLLIVGEGSEREAILKEIERLGLEDCVEVMGVRRDVARILAASDAFALSSDREGLPIAVLEAMAAARPVVATSVGDLPSVVRDGETGRVVPPRDPSAFAEALIDVLADGERAEEMGARGRRLVQDFGLRAMIDRYESLYSGK